MNNESILRLNSQNVSAKTVQFWNKICKSWSRDATKCSAV